MVLFDQSRLLDVYRVRPQGQLKRLKQYPGELEQLLGGAESADGSPCSEPPRSVAPVSDPGPETGSEAQLRDHPEMLGFRLELMRWRAVAAQAGNDEMVRRLDAAIDMTKKA